MCGEEYPQLRWCEELQARPLRVRLLRNGLWKVDWTGGLVSLYRSDPRGYLERGHEPRHLRGFRASPEPGSTEASDSRVDPMP